MVKCCVIIGRYLLGTLFRQPVDKRAAPYLSLNKYTELDQTSHSITIQEFGQNINANETKG